MSVAPNRRACGTDAWRGLVRETITKDRLSSVHLGSAGRQGLAARCLRRRVSKLASTRCSGFTTVMLDAAQPPICQSDTADSSRRGLWWCRRLDGR